MKKYNRELFSTNKDFENLVTQFVVNTFDINLKMQIHKATNTFLCNLIQYGEIQKHEKAGLNLHRIMMNLHQHGYVVVQKLHGRYTKYIISTSEKFDGVFNVSHLVGLV